MKKFTPSTKFAVFCNSILGEVKTAKSIDELMEFKMLERQKKFWSSIRYKDPQGRTICITREYLDEGMTLEEVISDHIMFGDVEEDIMCLNPRGSGTVII